MPDASREDLSQITSTVKLDKDDVDDNSTSFQNLQPNFSNSDATPKEDFRIAYTQNQINQETPTLMVQ